ncbi:type II secretion system protein [Candidatus Peregrinibacteria bacterium]|nr:MAG: type II secretion system protein [Candidatus Peregrinibacteria bacterium]
MKLLKNKSGETILEIIFALGILAMAITMATDYLTLSIKNVANAKNRVVAVNLAREGIEGMRDIRDTNWLRYSNKKRECWNHDPSVSPCNGGNPILPGNYVIYRDSNNEWKLGPTLVPNPPNPDIDATQLNLIDFDPATDNDGDGNNANDLDVFNHSAITGSLGEGQTPLQIPLFHRTLTLEYMDDAGIPPANPAALTDSDNRMIVRSRVTWNDGRYNFNTELQTVITDHLGRNSNLN